MTYLALILFRPLHYVIYFTSSHSRSSVQFCAELFLCTTQQSVQEQYKLGVTSGCFFRHLSFAFELNKTLQNLIYSHLCLFS